MRRENSGRSVTIVRVLSAAALLACAAGVLRADEPTAGDGAIKLEGEFNSERRSKLDALQNKPFDFALLAGLKGWTGEGAPSKASLDGKVVVLATWSSWYKTSHEPLRQAQALATAHAAKGLAVLALHHDRGWDRAADSAATLGVTVPIAHDQGNALRTALHVDQDPDFYIIDRAGNLRYADVTTGSLETAVIRLLAETKDQAAANAAAALAGGGAGGTAGGGAAETSETTADKSDGGYVQPAASEYAAVNWPAHNTGNLYAKNFQGKKLPSMGKLTWLSKEPSTDGKVRVVDMWATWCGPCVAVMPTMDKLQAQHADDLTIIGISDEPKSTVESFLKKKPHKYAQAIEQTGALKKALGVQGIPHVTIVSSDGVIRWQGNPHEPSFKTTLASVISLDPGVKARRAAKSGG